mgnify:CR=1 FL=1|tara:strand:- start:227 stop:760 length:534 start_codon:yes stop_codon:yes gene_type:complete
MACLKFKSIDTLAGRLSKTILTGGDSERTLQIFEVQPNRICRIVRAHNLGLDLWYTIESADGSMTNKPARTWHNGQEYVTSASFATSSTPIVMSTGAPTAGSPNAIGNFDDAWAADAGYGYSGRGLDLSGTWLEGGDKIWVHDTFDHEGATGVPVHHPAGFLISLEIFDVVTSGCPI